MVVHGWFVTCILATLAVVTVDGRGHSPSNPPVHGDPTPSEPLQPPVYGAPAPSTHCSALFNGLEECLPYIEKGSKEENPSGSCCIGLNKVAETYGECICYAFEHAAGFRIPVDVERAADLPSVCGVTNAPQLSNCRAHPPAFPSRTPTPPKSLQPPTPSVLQPASPTPAPPKSPKPPTPSVLPPASASPTPTPPKSPQPPTPSVLPPAPASPTPTPPKSPHPPTPSELPPATPSPTPTPPKFPPTPSVLPPASPSPTPTPVKSPQPRTPSMLPPGSPSPKSPKPSRTNPASPNPAAPASHGPAPAAQVLAKSAGYTMSSFSVAFSTVFMSFLFAVA